MSQHEILLRAADSTVLTHKGGLHARPSIMLTQSAKRFTSQVWIGMSDNGPWMDAKSITQVMALKTPTGATLFFVADGADAFDAVRTLIGMVQSDFANSKDY